MKLPAFLLVSLAAAMSTAATPNILFIIADDTSRHCGDSYGCDWVSVNGVR